MTYFAQNLSAMLMGALLLILYAVLSLTVPSADCAEREFFVFQNGLRYKSLEQETATLKELGYAGVSSAYLSKIDQRVAAYHAAGLKVFSVYAAARVGNNGPTFDKGIPKAIELLKGTDAIIELTVRGKIKDDDAQAVKIIREVADLAEKAGLRVALYPHAGFYVATTEQAMRVVKNVDRKNVGAIFNLCHYLKSEDEKKLEEKLTAMGDKLFHVTTCGADTDGSNWKTLIQTLDRGTFDQKRLFSTLDKMGYKGAIGLQCYNIKGDAKENLARSMQAWKKLNGKLEESPTPRK